MARAGEETAREAGAAARGAMRAVAAAGADAGSARRTGAVTGSVSDVRNWATRPESVEVLSARRCVTAVVSSTIAAFFWVNWSIWFTEALISCRAVACSRAAVAIEWM